jgi:FAD/FMN-containing dehydrogenase
MMSPDATKLAQALAGQIRGPVQTEDRVLERYATDQSMYEVRPLAVVHPQDAEDVAAVVRFAREEQIPLTPRAGGSGTAGAALGRGILLAIDRSGPMVRILGFEERQGQPLVTVEPGLVHDDLQRALRAHGLYLPSDPSSGAISLLGGNIGTKASGPHALRHGSIDRYLRDVQFVTAEGAVVDTADEASIPDRIREGVTALYQAILADGPAYRRLDARAETKLASGYNLFPLLRRQRLGAWVAQLLVGSVGTLGVVTRATLRSEPYIDERATTLITFRSLEEAGDAVQYIRPLDVAAIEIMNHRTIAIVRERRRDLQVPDGEVHMLLVEYEGPQRHQQIAQVERLVRENGYRMAGPTVTVESEEEQARLWRVRKALLPTIRGYCTDCAALSVVNDVGVGVAHLARFIRDVEALFDELGLVAAIYGHAGSGNLHLRPLFDRNAPDLPAQLARVAERVYATVLRYDGTITAEHGMGRLRAPYLAREWGEGIMRYMRRVKDIFDPDGVLNPDVMFSDRVLTDDLKPL